jgi:hypothetical protein
VASPACRWPAAGLVLGFANLSRGVIERGVAELRRALEMAV